MEYEISHKISSSIFNNIYKTTVYIEPQITVARLLFFLLFYKFIHIQWIEIKIKKKEIYNYPLVYYWKSMKTNEWKKERKIVFYISKMESRLNITKSIAGGPKRISSHISSIQFWIKLGRTRWGRQRAQGPRSMHFLLPVRTYVAHMYIHYIRAYT